MTELRSLLLARVQEVAQIYVDRVTWFLLNHASYVLTTYQREKLYSAMCDVTASLGRHTMAVLSVCEVDMDEHLSLLFRRLEVLNASSSSLGGPAMSRIFTEYRHKLQVG